MAFESRPHKGEPYADNARGQLQVSIRLAIGEKPVTGPPQILDRMEKRTESKKLKRTHLPVLTLSSKEILTSCELISLWSDSSLNIILVTEVARWNEQGDLLQ